MPGYSETPDMIIAWTEKAGCRSITKMLRDHLRPKAKDVVHSDKPIRLYLRHPLERLRSMWAHFYSIRLWEYRGQKGPPAFPAFCSFILAGHENIHWLPQIAQHKFEGKFIPTEIYKLENIADTWPKEYYPLLHRNKGTYPKPAIVYRADEIREYYAEDLEYWNDAI